MRLSACSKRVQCAVKVASSNIKGNVPSAATKPTVGGGLVQGRRPFLGSAALLGFTSLLASPQRSLAAAAKDKAQEVLENPMWPEKFPFTAEHFQRYDESDDKLFYNQPRIVTHIDDNAIKALTKFYEEKFPASGNPDVALLDVCSSWISHYPAGYTAGRIAGLGMNGDELQRNSVLTEYTVKDLNEDPKLPYEDASFDIITNAVSVDYLNKPLEIFKEMQRCLKPGGMAIMSFSNRCFPTKAIALWTASGDEDHVWIVGSYFHYVGGFDAPEARDITINKNGDPMYVVYAHKSA